MIIPVCPDCPVLHDYIGRSLRDLIPIFVQTGLISITDVVFGIAGQDLNVAFVVIVKVSEEAGASSRIASDSSPDTDGGVEDV